MNAMRNFLSSAFFGCVCVSALTLARDVPTETARCDHYENGARSGVAAHQLRYGYCFLQGKGRAQDLGTAEFWIRKSAENGNVEAIASLASIWVFEQERADKYTEALELLQLSVERSNENANFQLGMMYHNGLGVREDDDIAIEFYERAAEGDNETAIAILALVNYFGLYGQPVDLSQSRTWLVRLCENRRLYGIFDFRRYFMRMSSDKKLARYALSLLEQHSMSKFLEFVSQVCPSE